MKLRAAVLASLVASVAAQVCEVCGPGKEVTKLEEIFAFPSQPPISCIQLQEVGLEGFIPFDICPVLANLIDTACGCAYTATPPAAPPVTVAPIAFEPSPAPSSPPTAPTVSPNPTAEYVPVLILIKFDWRAQRTGWTVQDATTGTTVAGVPIGGYESSQGSTVLENLSLRFGTEYICTLLDSDSNGYYREVFIYLGSEVDGTKIIGYFDQYSTPDAYSHTFTFVASPDGIRDNIYPTISPSNVPTEEPSAPTGSPAPSLSEKTVLMVLTLDNYGSETGWRIETVDGNVVHEVETGTYTGYNNGDVITEQVNLPAETNKDYVLVLVDTYGDGLDTPAILYLGEVEDPGNVLAYLEASHGSFSELRLPFVVDQPLVGIFPTAAPTSAAPTPSPGPHEPCNICGNNTAVVVTNPDGIFEYTADIFLRCGSFEKSGTEGMISSTFCATLPALLNETCGCSM